MNAAQDIRVAIARLYGTCCDDVITAMAAEGWNVRVVEDLAELISLAMSGAYHLAVAACRQPRKLPREHVHTLMSLQTDMSVIFLVPPQCEVAECPPLMGVVSENIHRLNQPTTELMEVFRRESRSVLSDQTEYTIMCVDDDEEFLASLKAFLPARLKDAFPRFALNFEFFASPEDALAETRAIAGGELAVVICDQVMPEMEGIELLKQIKGICPNTHCVLLTGFAALESAVTAINERVLDKYFFKPIEEPVDFSNNIRHLLREYHLRVRTEAQRNRLMSQFEFIRTISAAANIDKALSATVDFLREQMYPQQVIVVLAEEGGLVVRAGFGLPAELPVGAEAPEDSIFEWVFRRRRPFLAADNDNLPEGLSPLPLASSSLAAVPLIRNGVPLGVIMVSGPACNKPFTRSERMLLSFVADVTSVTARGFEDRHALEEHYVGTMASLMETVEAKDSYTRGHTERVTELAVTLAGAVGAKGSQLEDIRRAALLHDIGKIAIPDSIILKPGPLDAQEHSVVEEHSVRADKILQHLKFLGPARMIVRAHHERYDGKGYPDGLCGEEIPLGGRILAIADTYDAMTSARPYRHAMAPSEALTEIEVNAGKQFDPKLAKAFLETMKRRICPQPASVPEPTVLKEQR
ncbi:MAG: HD domain-containing phosphohydrolase [Planctomycetota bacterium]|nr:HD domain-containing phosphohydrolase [Planctomycetota bacterium]